VDSVSRTVSMFPMSMSGSATARRISGSVASVFDCPPFDSKKIEVATFWWRRAFLIVSTASLSSRTACDSFLPQMSVVTAPSSFAPPSCSKTADRKMGSSSGAVPITISGSLCAPLNPARYARETQSASNRKMPRVCWNRGNCCHLRSKTDSSVGWKG